MELNGKKANLAQTINGDNKWKPQSQEIIQHSKETKLAVAQNKDEFLLAFNPKMQNNYIQHFDRCFIGNALKLNQVAKAYEFETAILWLKIQLFDLALFTGVKKPSEEQVTMLCETILANYGYLKVTEIMVFFSKFKAGKFERFFGNFDAMVITSSLATFVELRKNWIFEALQNSEKENRKSRQIGCTPMPQDITNKIKKLC